MHKNSRKNMSIRRDALGKLASLSAKSPSSAADRHISKLCRLYPKRSGQEDKLDAEGARGHPSSSRVRMSLRELEVLVALCRAAPAVHDFETAKELLHQILPYLPQAYSQTLGPSPFLRDLNPSPWEILSFDLTLATVSIGLNHPSLRDNVNWALEQYILGCSRVADRLSTTKFSVEQPKEARTGEGSLDAVVLILSMVGFLGAATKAAEFWSPHERLRLIRTLRSMFSEDFMVAVETALSTVRNANSTGRGLRDWKRVLKHYAATGRPLSVMLLQHAFMRLVAACSSRLVANPAELQEADVLVLLQSHNKERYMLVGFVDNDMVESLADIAADGMGLLDDESDYLRLGSAWQQRLAFAVKASALTSFLCCSVLKEDIAEPEILMTWLEGSLGDPVQMADEDLAAVVLRCMAITAKSSPSIASSLIRTLPRFIVEGGINDRTAEVAAECLASILSHLPQDVTISTLYSLGNVLSVGAADERNGMQSPVNDGGIRLSQYGSPNMHDGNGSSLSLAASDSEQKSHVYGMIIQAIVIIATRSKDYKITALALSMLGQKIGKVGKLVDARIVTEAAILAIDGAPGEFKSLLKLYVRLNHEAMAQENHVIVDAVKNARIYLSRFLKRESPLHQIYLVHLLDTIVSQGDIHEGKHSQVFNTKLATEEISQLLQPLAVLALSQSTAQADEYDESVLTLARDTWFNLVVHGFQYNSSLAKRHVTELRILASRSTPLIAEERADQLESEIELNTVLRRGSGSSRVAEQKRNLIEMLPACESEIRNLSYPELIFLSAAHLVETLRAEAGDCTRALTYFLDPKLKSGPLGSCMVAVATGSVETYLLRTLTGNIGSFSATIIAQQLSSMFEGCCHRIPKVQHVAYTCADRIIERVPSSLCQKASLFALLELLTIMWTSCLEAETDEYNWASKYSSSRGMVSVELSDSYSFRQHTLNTLHKHARTWVTKVLNIAPLDVKGLLQTYLSEYDDEGAYGHVSLGRSFAVEMGSIIPQSDHRLSKLAVDFLLDHLPTVSVAIDVQRDLNINTASDFIAQYTTRQEYRYADAINDHGHESQRANGYNSPTLIDDSLFLSACGDAVTLLAGLEARTLSRTSVPVSELRNTLRWAAALLCRSKGYQSAIVHYLVCIPFNLFTKQSIKLGMSLWMGVIKENPRIEPRIFVEIAEQWIRTVRGRLGLFNDKLPHHNPFYSKQEFAPSDKQALLKRQQLIYNLIAPHLRLLQFLSSHFNSTRLGSPHIQKTYHRLMQITLNALRHTTSQPLAREVHFHVILLGLRILRYSTGLDVSVQWRFKDQILFAGLAWFCSAPRWTFGGNRLQVKAETHLLADVIDALQSVETIGSKTTASMRSLQAKSDVLQLLLENEQDRLMVWLFPLDHERKHHFTSGQHGKVPSEAALAALMNTAWSEYPALVLRLVDRFHLRGLPAQVRSLVLKSPEKVLNEPDALSIMLGSSLPDDVSSQLKYLLYWAPVDPITAVTYFLPAYGNHPFIIQYAMRALESHSVDVTFFFVPQIVQTLRYDVLGYVERYIIETGRFSQLFAHQIIWNMKANAYKDENSQIPDSMKPMLDEVETSLVSSFDATDRAFYEREFHFFNEVTSISGKLRPFIKKSKPEKKQKIEEELRKIQVEVGVYLPSNPEGVVIGIDRKSGKPLQSHAKAPYMATFRIRKERNSDREDVEDNLKEANADGSNAVTDKATSYEVWQSAIFKVGDDCRQDVLALQMIAAFRGIFNSVGLDVYVFPYRVTATAPGCGVIDVLPNSISRDMLGREAVNGLYDYFVSKYGGEDSIAFQEARNNFVKSMAAYSVISYLLQFKDRHNGNIMIDDAGHILHIDFGFCFDIAPGGVKFERAPFKLTSEMVAVMGGSTESQSFRWFEELSIKAFLASRLYVEKLASIVLVMLDSGLPCFKPETIQHFKERFVLESSEREAAEFMKRLVDISWRSYSTKVYDQFQLLTNGIPY